MVLRPDILTTEFFNHQPEYFTLRGVKHSPCRADFIGANRDEVAPPRGRTDIFPKNIFISVKYPG